MDQEGTSALMTFRSQVDGVDKVVCIVMKVIKEKSIPGYKNGLCYSYMCLCISFY